MRTGSGSAAASRVMVREMTDLNWAGLDGEPRPVDAGQVSRLVWLGCCWSIDAGPIASACYCRDCLQVGTVRECPWALIPAKPSDECWPLEMLTRRAWSLLCCALLLRVCTHRSPRPLVAARLQQAGPVVPKPKNRAIGETIKQWREGQGRR